MTTTITDERRAGYDWDGFAATDPILGLSTALPDVEALTAADAIRHAGLDWTVDLVPAFTYFRGEPVTIDGRVAVQRQDTGASLGVVTPSYHPVQPVECFDFADVLVEDGSAKYVAAGSRKGGARLFMLAKINRQLLLPGDDLVDPYLFLQNSYDGSSSLAAYITPVRLRCMNMVRMAIREARSSFKIAHRSTIQGKLVEARDALGITFNYLDEMENVARELHAAKMPQQEMQRFLERLIPYDPQANLDTDRAARTKAEARQSILWLFNEAENLENVRGTKWAAWNAVAEYHDHFTRSRTAEGAFKRVMEDTRLKDRALALLAA